MRKGIRNYTSDQSVSKSTQIIQDILVGHKAKQIMYEYGQNGNVTGLGFVIDTAKGTIPIKLPARIEKVEAIFLKAKKDANPYSYRSRELTPVQKQQTINTAWKNLADWVDMQMTMLDLDLVKMEEIFLPYMTNNKGQTFFEVMENKGFQLESGEIEEGKVL